MRKDWIEIEIVLSPVQPHADILTALLSEEGFDFFSDSETGLIAYADAQKVDKQVAEEIIKNYKAVVNFEFRIIADQNWNATWESSFSPIDLPGKCRVKAPFHPNLDGVLNLNIEPKMSFGTGHHATTFMMIEILYDYKNHLNNKQVLDMGCGTGVLAILAEKLGAKNIDAVDIEDWAYKNTIENIAMNQCSKVNTILGGSEKIVGKKYDIILANINKNVLKDDIKRYAECLNKNGIMAISGFFKIDCDELSHLAESTGICKMEIRSKEDWASMVFKK